MTARKKKGIFTMVGGVVSILLGAILVGTTQTPVWIPQVLSLIGMVGEFLGFIFVFPDTD